MREANKLLRGKLRSQDRERLEEYSELRTGSGEELGDSQGARGQLSAAVLLPVLLFQESQLLCCLLHLSLPTEATFPNGQARHPAEINRDHLTSVD